jgi:hypothetical protein
MINLTGIQTLQAPEDRALGYVEVTVNGVKYDWLVYIPANISDFDQYLQSIEQKVIDDILTKEAEWENLNPKTKEIFDPMGEPQQVEVTKSEIVKPTIPDYYALRRAEYPSIGDQLDALWKGVDSPEFQILMNRIQEVKNRYPKE